MITKVVFHIDWEIEERLVMALNNIENLFNEVPAEEASVSLIINGAAVQMFRRDRKNDYSDTIEELAEKGVHFCLCNNSLNKFEIDHSDLLSGWKLSKQVF